MAQQAGKDGASAAAEAIDLAAVIDDGELRAPLVWLAALLTLALAVDGFDVVMLGFLAAPISQDFGVSALSLGWLLAAGQFGLILGGIAGGLLADKAGRRPALIASILLFGLGSLVSAAAQDYYAFGAARVFGGLGLGAAAPAVASYFVELLPRRWLGRISVLAFAANMFGGTICAFTAAQVVPALGWRAMFWIGGIVPLVVILPLLLALVPESPRFLARKGRDAAQVARALARSGIVCNWREGQSFAIAAAASGQGRLLDTLAPAWRRDTIVLWVMSVTLMFTSVGLISLGALLLESLGTDQAQAIGTMSYYSFAGLTGALASVFLVPRFGTRTALAALLSLAALAMVALALQAASGGVGPAWATALPMFAMGFGLNGSLIILFPMVANFYPTEFRAAGSGAVIGIGRTGSTTSLVALTAILQAAGPLTVLAVTLGMTVITIASVLVFRGHSAPDSPAA